MKRRIPYVRLMLFLIIGLVAAGLVAVQTLGSDTFAGYYNVSVKLADTGGLVQDSQVTYLGKPIGTISSIDIDPGGAGVTMKMSLSKAYPIPSNAQAVVSMDVPIAIEHLDLQPSSDAGPFLREGSVIDASKTTLPIPFDVFLGHATDLLKTFNTKDLATVGDELSVAFNGAGPQVQALLNNSNQLINSTGSLTPQLLDLTNKGLDTLQSSRGFVSGLPGLATALRNTTSELNSLTPQTSAILTNGRQLLAQILPLLHSNQPAIAQMLLNTTGVVGTSRLPALNATFDYGPTGLGKFADIFHPSTTNPGSVEADISIVTALGPVCYYGTARRTPQDLGARPVEPNWSCPGNQQYLQQRGAANAPVPGNSAQQKNNAADTLQQPQDPGTNPAPRQTPGSPATLLLQGVQ